MAWDGRVTIKPNITSEAWRTRRTLEADERRLQTPIPEQGHACEKSASAGSVCRRPFLLKKSLVD